MGTPRLVTQGKRAVESFIYFTIFVKLGYDFTAKMATDLGNTAKRALSENGNSEIFDISLRAFTKNIHIKV